MCKVILPCLLLLLVGCATNQKSRSSYFFENITLTCAYNTLEKMDGISKVWINYERKHGYDDDGIGFEGKGFFGSVLIQDVPYQPPRNFSVDVVIYSDDGFLYRNFAIWGPGKRLLRIEKIKQQIQESLLASCNE